MLDVEAIRKDFPTLRRTVYGKPLVYLDNAATSQSATHCLGEEATPAYEKARSKTAAFINAPSPDCIVFTRNTTESINLVAYTWGRANIGPGDEILLTEMEHHSNLIPWQRLAAEKGASIRYI